MEKSLFVGNISYGALEAEIEELFSRHGSVKEVRFAMDFAKGRFRGYGFVKMDEQGAHLAIQELNGFEFQGRPLQVTLAQSKNPKDS